MTGNYDPETNLAFWGTGNGGPWMGDQRPGDNLYVASTVAIDVATGQIKGHFQYNPNESWDWDEVSPPLLIDYQRNGRTIKGLINVARNGYLWFLERTAGPIKFVDGKPYVDAERVPQPRSRRPGSRTSIPARKPGTGKRAEFCPWLARRQELAADRLQPADADDLHPGQQQPVRSDHGRARDVRRRARLRGHAVRRAGVRSAGRRSRRWRSAGVERGHRSARVASQLRVQPNWGSMLATAGGLVFSGGTNDRKVHAFDATTGKLLWEFVTNSGIVAPPTTFTIDGKQYLAVLSGWGGDVRGMNGASRPHVSGQGRPSRPTAAASGCSRCRKLVAARACARGEDADVAELDCGRISSPSDSSSSRFLSWHITLKLRSSTPPNR